MTKSNYEKISLRVYLVDFFGSLIPGLLYICLVFFTSIWPLFLSLEVTGWWINGEATEDGNQVASIFNLFKDLNTSLSILIIFLALISAYVIGTMFYRRDIKRPDFRSYKKIVNGV